jgi:glycosyltransferase involved in cell wall biosynthesis
MKIVHAAPWYLPDALGGTEIYVATLCRILREAGHDAIVAAPSPGGSSHTEQVIDGVRVLRYATPSRPSRAETLERIDTEGASMFTQWVQREQPDIVHFHTLTTGLALREVAAVHGMGIPTVFTAHSASLGYVCQRGTLLEFGTHVCNGVRTERECAACVMQMRGIPRAVASALSRLPAVAVTDRPSRVGALLQATAVAAHNRERQRALVGALDACVALTQWAADALLANGAPPERVHINRLGIRDMLAGRPLPHREPAPSFTRDRPMRIGYLGRYDAIKGVAILARAAALLPDDAAVEIVFRGPAAGPVEAAVKRDVERILGGDVRFRAGGAIDADATYDFLRTLDLLCCPSLCAEGGPTVALEARAAGTPVIGSDIGGISEIIRDDVDGALFPPGDAAALARLIGGLTRDPAILDSWRANTPRVRTMRDVASDYLQLYETICRHASAL